MTETTVVSISLGSFDWGPLALATKSILGLIAANLILGVAAAIKAKTFELERLPEFLTLDVLPGLIALALVAVGILTETAYVTLMGLAAVSLVAAALAPSLKANFKALFGSAPPEPPAA